VEHINEDGDGYEVRRRKESGHILSHLFYMDNLKLYAKNETEMKRLLKQVATFSNDIGMKFGMEKCRTMTVKKRKQMALDEVEPLKSARLILAPTKNHKSTRTNRRI
jgi:hypothetical protein